MRDRSIRLARMVRMYDLLQTTIEARCVALANEDSELEGRALELVASLSADAFADGLQRVAIKRLAAISRDRLDIAARFANERERRLTADRRVRAAERALDRLQKEIVDKSERRDLEEIRLVPMWPPASRKPRGDKS